MLPRSRQIHQILWFLLVLCVCKYDESHWKVKSNSSYVQAYKASTSDSGAKITGTYGQQMLGAACRSTSHSAPQSALVWIWLVITVFCAYPGAQQLLSRVQTLHVIRAPDEQNLAPLRESSEKTTAHVGLVIIRGTHFVGDPLTSCQFLRFELIQLLCAKLQILVHVLFACAPMSVYVSILI